LKTNNEIRWREGFTRKLRDGLHHARRVRVFAFAAIYQSQGLRCMTSNRHTRVIAADYSSARVQRGFFEK
jgi:hypothetical protein